MRSHTHSHHHLHRAGIGFDRVFDLLEQASRTQNADNYPPFDSIRIDDERYQIVLAVAGFSEPDITITATGTLLTVRGEQAASVEGTVLHRGIARRPFERRFELADHLVVTSAALANGLLTIDLERQVPEAMKPRQIAITGAAPVLAGGHRAEEGTASAAA